jgi:hypothetical protein
MKTRILIAGDLHCGHLLGLTTRNFIRDFKLSEIMHKLWDHWLYYTRGHWDVAFWMGDLLTNLSRYTILKVIRNVRLLKNVENLSVLYRAE